MNNAAADGLEKKSAMRLISNEALNSVLRNGRSFLTLPLRGFEKLDEFRKVRRCTMGEGGRLYPVCRIDNFQRKPAAILIGSHCRILGQLMVLRHGGSISLGDSCFIGENTRIWSGESVQIGDRVLISHGVNIHDTISHSLSAARRHEHFNQIFSTGHPKAFDDLPPQAPIVIEDDVWLGFNSVVLKGVTIGRGAVVGAASVVTKDVAPYSIVVGNPAKVVGEARP